MWNALSVVAFAVMMGLIAVQIYADPIWIGYVALSAFVSFACGAVAMGNALPVDKRREEGDTQGDAQTGATLVSLCLLIVTLVWWGVTRWPWF